MNVRVLENPGNKGKGYSVRHGMLEARHEWVLFSDADMSAPIDELPKLFAAAEREHAAQLADLHRGYVRLRQRTLGTLIGAAFAAGLLVNFADQCPNCQGRGVVIDAASLE